MFASGLKIMKALMFMTTKLDKEIIKPTIAAIQMCSSHIVDDNLKLAENLISEAAKNNANIVVLPEMFAMMGAYPKDKVLVKEKFGDGKIQNFLSEQAKANNIWIVGGTIPIECNDINKVRAASLVFDEIGCSIVQQHGMKVTPYTPNSTTAFPSTPKTFRLDKKN